MEYWIGRLFFIIIMFLINSIFTAELKPKNIGLIKNTELKESHKGDENNESNLKKEKENERRKDNKIK